MIRLYDTAAAAVRPLEPAGDVLGMYVCGITPYDSAHLGHAFTYHVFDVVARRLRAAGTPVRSVRNVTDCDDDIFRVARRRGIDHRALVAEQVARFEAEMASIAVLPADTMPYASAHVPAMIDWISELESAGFAYARGGHVYFDVSAFDRYGALSRLGAPAMAVLSRERGGDPDDPRKDDPLDFVLWQPSLPDELVWDAPWSRGRPGWHIECSVIASQLLPSGIDLHGGGDDLVFPHHECEVAQFEAVADRPLARHWVHVAMVGLEGVKMSKSLGNLVFVSDLVRRSGAAAVRLLLAGHHHRATWSYVEADLDAAARRAEGYRRCLEGHTRLDPAAAARLEADFFARLDDDLDTPGALAVLDAAAAEAAPGPDGGVAATAWLPRLLGILGVQLGAEAVAAAPA